MEYIVKEDDGYNWARWKLRADSRKKLIEWWNENGLDEDNAELIDHTTEMPYGGKIEIESEVVCDACDGKGYLTDVYDTEAGETQTQRCDSCQLFESDKQAQSHIEWLLTRKVRMINKDDIIVTKDELYLQQAPSLNFELDTDELLEKALLRGFVEKVGDDKYKINNDYSGSQE
jgi:hypothetical protein